MVPARRHFSALLGLGVFSVAAWGQAPTSPTAQLLSEVIRINTSNPPGNEEQVARFLAPKFEQLGFEVTIIPTPQAGKSHFIARLKGDGSKRPVLLAAHADVVGVEREKWSLDPFGGIIKDGYVYGRGAIDFKGGIAVFGQAVMMLAKNKIPLHRDVIFLVEADEEGGAHNTTALAREHWDKLDCEFALNEGGWIIKGENNKVRYVSISTADKGGTTLWITARGTSTHSSMPRPDSAIYTLARALVKLADYETPPRLIDSTREFFLTLAKTSEPPMSTYFQNLVTSEDPKLVAEASREIGKNILLHAIMRNSIAPVFLNAGLRSNIIPGSATARVGIRTLPGTNTQELISEVKSVINDPMVDVTLPPPDSPDAKRLAMYMAMSAKAKPSTKDTDLYRALAHSARAVWPGAPVTSYLFQAGTDALAWRTRDVPVYGIYPYPISPEDLTRMHGNDERVPVASLDQGTELIYKTLIEVAAR